MSRKNPVQVFGTRYGRLAQLVEHLLDVQGVRDSSSLPSTRGAVRAIARAAFFYYVRNGGKTFQYMENKGGRKAALLHLTPIGPAVLYFVTIHIMCGNSVPNMVKCEKRPCAGTEGEQ